MVKFQCYCCFEPEPRGNAVGARGFKVVKKFLGYGINGTTMVDTPAFPTLIVQDSQIDEMLTTVKQALEQVD